LSGTEFRRRCHRISVKVCTMVELCRGRVFFPVGGDNLRVSKCGFKKGFRTIFGLFTTDVSKTVSRSVTCQLGLQLDGNFLYNVSMAQSGISPETSLWAWPIFCQCGAPGTCRRAGPISHSLLLLPVPPFPFLLRSPVLSIPFLYLLCPPVTSLPLPSLSVLRLRSRPLKSSYKGLGDCCRAAAEIEFGAF